MCSIYTVIEASVRNATKRLYLPIVSLTHFRFPVHHPFFDDNGITFLVEFQMVKTHITVRGPSLKNIPIIKAQVRQK